MRVVVSTHMFVKKPTITRRWTPARRSSTSRGVPTKPLLTSFSTTTSRAVGSKPGFWAPVGSENLSGDSASRESCRVNATWRSAERHAPSRSDMTTSASRLFRRPVGPPQWSRTSTPTCTSINSSAVSAPKRRIIRSSYRLRCARRRALVEAEWIVVSRRSEPRHAGAGQERTNLVRRATRWCPGPSCRGSRRGRAAGA